MEANDFTFSMLAAAVAAAGGSVRVTASQLVRMNSAYRVEMTDDGEGGQILTLVERTDTYPSGLERALDFEHQDEAR